MDTLTKLIEKDPWLLWVLLAVLLILVFVIVVGYIVAFVKGREISLWSLKIGASAGSRAAGDESPEVVKSSGEIGVVRYEEDSHALDDVKSHGLRTATEIWLIGATMHYTLSNLKERLVERIIAGATVNILVADPTGKDFEASARGFGQTVAELDHESMMTLGGCQYIINRISKEASVTGSVHARVLDCVFTAGVYFFDPRTLDATMILVPHIFGRDAPLSPGLLVKSQNSRLLRDYFVNYSRVWNRALSFEVWSSRHPEYVRRLADLSQATP